MLHYNIKIMEKIGNSLGFPEELGAGAAGGYRVPGVYKVGPGGIFCSQMRAEGSGPPQLLSPSWESMSVTSVKAHYISIILCIFL